VHPAAQVQVVPQGFLVPDAGLAVLRRLPPAVTQRTQSFLQAIFRVRFDESCSDAWSDTMQCASATAELRVRQGSQQHSSMASAGAWSFMWQRCFMFVNWLLQHSKTWSENSTMTVHPSHVQFSNQSSAIPVAAQSALLAHIDDVMPTFYISANMTGIAPAADGSYDAAVLFIVGNTLQEFGPQVSILSHTHRPGPYLVLCDRAANVCTSCC
jgi:hypothetical protein